MFEIKITLLVNINEADIHFICSFFPRGSGYTLSLRSHHHACITQFMTQAQCTLIQLDYLNNVTDGYNIQYNACIWDKTTLTK